MKNILTLRRQRPARATCLPSVPTLCQEYVVQMKAPHSLLLTTLLMAAATPALAASSIDLNVTGVITPNACTPTLSAGGVVDYGKIAFADLYVESATLLPTANLQLSVECDAATLYVFHAVENSVGGGDTSFGLGVINQNRSIGAYHLGLNSSTAEGLPISTLSSRDNGVTWIQSSPNALWIRGRLAGFGDDSGGAWAPVPIRNLTSNLLIYGYIAATRGLTLTEEQPLTGSATLEMRYL